MADFRPVDSNKGRILMIHPATAVTKVEDANEEWIEIVADLSSDFANWRLQHLRGLWKPEVAKPVESRVTALTFELVKLNVPAFAVTSLPFASNAFALNCWVSPCELQSAGGVVVTVTRAMRG